jgi:hypothetical protein
MDLESTEAMQLTSSSVASSFTTHDAPENHVQLQQLQQPAPQTDEGGSDLSSTNSKPVGTHKRKSSSGMRAAPHQPNSDDDRRSYKRRTTDSALPSLLPVASALASLSCTTSNEAKHSENLLEQPAEHTQSEQAFASVHLKEHTWLKSTVSFFGLPEWIPDNEEEEFKNHVLASVPPTVDNENDDDHNKKACSTQSTWETLPSKPEFNPFVVVQDEVFQAAIDYSKDNSKHDTAEYDTCAPHSYELCHLPEIYKGLYLGNAEAAWDGTILQNSNITCILNVTKDQKLAPDMLEKIKHYKQISIEDNGEAKLFQRDLKQAILFLDRCYLNGFNVLVHCKAGKSRSVSIVLAWAMGRFRKTLTYLLPVLSHRRNGLNVNGGFREKLCALEKFIHRECTLKRGAGQRCKKGGEPNPYTLFYSGGQSRF